MTAPRDTGAQPERTALAWRRTALAVAAGSVVGARLSVPALGPLAIALGAVGAALAAAVWWTAARRYPAARRSLVESARLPTTGGPFVAVAVATVVFGALALGFVVSHG
jgi:uncharacterized membrane protein YidH (DUF202 family)